MTQYIDKDALVAEIEKQGTIQPQLSWFTDKLIQIINSSIEVKNVDLEEDLDEWMKYGPHTNYPWCTIPDAIKITAEHFFELGLKAQKGE